MNVPCYTSHQCLRLRSHPPQREARAELESVLASTLFVRSPRLSRLLQYLCNKYFEGSTEEVKEYQIGVEVLGRPPSFDPAEDAAARVEAHRLRKRLKEYYETEGRSHALRIEVPLGHYAVAFQTVTVEPPPEEKEEEVQSSATPCVPTAFQSPQRSRCRNDGVSTVESPGGSRWVRC